MEIRLTLKVSGRLSRWVITKEVGTMKIQQVVGLIFGAQTRTRSI